MMGLRVDTLPAHLQAAINKELAKQGQPMVAPARNKYGAKRTELDGVVYDSKGESDRSAVLKQMLKGGLIRNLKEQVPFPLMVGSCRIGVYKADFVYEEPAGGEWREVVEDFKGVRTALYRWKAKHMQAQYGITIKETGTRKATKAKRKNKGERQ